MNVLDLFSGIGGFSLGLERAGMKTIAFCEIEEFPRKVLKKHWPNVPIFNDIRNLHATDIADTVDVICGGYPCQPFSLAGKRQGKDDDRHLWPEMFRLVREIKPNWIIAENVAGHINMGLDEVLSDLESEGYQTTTFVIPACAVNAPHRRDRVWIVANNASQPDRRHYREQEERQGEESGKGNGNSYATDTTRDMLNRSWLVRERGRCEHSNGGFSSPDTESGTMRNVRENIGAISGEINSPINTGCFGDGDDRRKRATNPDSNNKGLAKRQRENTGRTGKNGGAILIGENGSGWGQTWLEVATRLCRVDDGIPRKLYRNQRLKALGNAVVPQIPEIIGRAIMEIENS